VKLNQPLRKSSAGELRWSQESGLVYLLKTPKCFIRNGAKHKVKKSSFTKMTDMLKSLVEVKVDQD